MVAASTKHLVPRRRAGMKQLLGSSWRLGFVVLESAGAYKGLVATEMSAKVS
jgi:hypothetical protein